jgi:hypothetical protein
MGRGDASTAGMVIESDRSLPTQAGSTASDAIARRREI